MEFEIVVEEINSGSAHGVEELRVKRKGSSGFSDGIWSWGWKVEL
jgi:hypothetical protein